MRVRILRRTSPESEAPSRETDSNDDTKQEAKNAILEDEVHDLDTREENDDMEQWNNEEDYGEEEMRKMRKMTLPLMMQLLLELENLNLTPNSSRSSERSVTNTKTSSLT